MDEGRAGPVQAPARDVPVSAREAEVLSALGEHLTNAEIGSRLFISIRTVESHVSSLLRKFGVEDRRALATLANRVTSRPADPASGQAGSPTPGPDPDGTTSGRDGRVHVRLPVPLTSFVGRAGERAALADELGRHRLVTALGPGGVGKTRLALAVAGDLRERFADGAVYVDLVPITDPALIGTTICSAIGLGEQQGRSSAETVQAWLAERQVLLVLDNCEHLLDGVVGVLEALLAGSPGLTVLATSRSRLLVPFERVFAVPGLSTERADGTAGDAVALFLGRAAAAGVTLGPDDGPRVAALCRGLDGMALSIELAAARLSSLGLDGLEAGLSDRLRMLAGGRRADDRHRSLASTLNWSYELLPPAEQVVLRRVSVFAAPFTPESAVAVLAGWPPVSEPDLPGILASLADQSLLIARPDRNGTRYRALETIRQYGAGRLNEAGEAASARDRHLHWCITMATELDRQQDDSAAWRVRHDLLADELRSGMRWASDGDQCRSEAYLLARTLGDLSFARGLPGDSQLRYEQAARLAADDLRRAESLRHAAGVAEARHFGNDALRLRRAAADSALLAGRPALAAIDLARAAELINRGPGLMATEPEPGLMERLMAEAEELAGSDEAARARLLAAKAFAGDEWSHTSAGYARAAIDAAQRIGDPLTESAALDYLLASHLARGQIRTAMECATRRTGLLADLPVTAEAGLEFFDAFNMAADTAIAAGALRTARTWAEQVRDLPFNREEAHLGTSRLMLVSVLTGDWDQTLALSGPFREAWERAGQPRAGNLSRGASAAAAAYGLRGDDAARAQWLEAVQALATPGRPAYQIHCDEFFDAMLFLHRGEVHRALATLAAEPEDFRAWHNGVWRPWYTAMWAEASVLGGRPEAAERLERAARITAQNPIAAAIVDRAAALADGGDQQSRLLKIVDDLSAAGCAYQVARTRIMIGGDERVRGEAAVAAMGGIAMVWDTDWDPDWDADRNRA